MDYRGITIVMTDFTSETSRIQGLKKTYESWILHIQRKYLSLLKDRDKGRILKDRQRKGVCWPQTSFKE